MKLTAETKLYTLQEVADMLRVSRQTVYNYHTAGKLKAFKLAKEYRVTEDQLQDFIQHTQKANHN